MKKHTCLMLCTVLAGAFLLARCLNPLEEVSPQDGPGVPLGSGGFVRLVFTGNGRTLLPEESVELTRYTRWFESDAGTRDPLTVTALSELSGPIDLVAGTWTLTLKGFIGEDEGAAAQARTEVLIRAGETSVAELILRPTGRGVFNYQDFLGELEGLSLTRAFMDIVFLGDNTKRRVDLLSGDMEHNPGALTMDAGYYELFVCLYTADGYAGKTDVLHIYHDKVTPVPYTSDNFKFIPTIYPEGNTLAEALAAISASVVEGGDYTVVLKGDEPAFAAYPLSYGGKRVTITLAGNGTGADTVTLDGTGSLFTVEAGLTLILRDITLEGQETERYNDSLLRVNAGGTLVMENGACVGGNTVSSYNGGGGVYIGNGGTFAMSGGTISENSADVYGGGGGGGVCVGNAGTFTMSGGTISENSADGGGGGGGVYVGNGDFIMSGGTISGNAVVFDSFSSSSSSGGGVFVDQGTFTMSNGTISGNTASSGGGIYIENGIFTMDDGTISGNAADGGGGVYLYGGTFTMSGKDISGNTASSGGGIYIENGIFTIDGGTISENVASRGEGIYVAFVNSLPDVWNYGDGRLIISGKARIDLSNNICLYANADGNRNLFGSIVFAGDPSVLDHDITVDLIRETWTGNTFLNYWTEEIIHMEGGEPVPENVRSRFKLRTFTNNYGETSDISGYVIKSDGKGSWREPAEILSFTVNGVEAPINRLISLVLPYDTDLTALAPEITVSPGATVFPESGKARNFSFPLMYWVTASDGTAKTYTVDIRRAGYTPPGGLTMVDSYTPAAEDLQLAIDGYVITVVGTGYTNYRWYVDGIPRGSSDSLNMEAYSQGKRSVSLTADKNGVPYSAKVTVQAQ
jgi:hypothetical protein